MNAEATVSGESGGGYLHLRLREAGTTRWVNQGQCEGQRAWIWGREWASLSPLSLTMTVGEVCGYFWAQASGFLSHYLAGVTSKAGR